MNFSIPEEYRDKLQPIEVTDHRSDAEIFASFLEHRPVTSEKNVWAYWHSGISSMPKWCQKNAIDWVRILGPKWTVRVLDNVSGSPNNTLRYVPENLLPPAFVDQTMDGPYIGQHGADLTRSACLYEYGGAWMDAGSILIRHIDRICWDELENSDSPYRVAIPIIYGIMGANHFVAARKRDPFIYLW
jgi:Capsular polysaccharide synthesis protein